MDAEIAIVGAGPAGCATALFLAACEPSLRDRVLVLDKATFPRDKICAGAVGRRAERLLATIGVVLRVPAVHVRALRVTAGGRTLVTHAAREIGKVVRRREYDAALVRAVRAAGIAVREGVRLRHMARGNGGWCLATSSGDLSARVVVGADGVGSAVRRALGLPAGRYRAQAVEFDTPHQDERRDVLAFDLSDRSLSGYAWDFPTLVDGVPMVCRGMYALTHDTAEAAGGWPPTRETVGERFVAHLAKRGLAVDLRAVRTFAERGLDFHEPCAGYGVLLVGEAAGVDPVLGEGIAQALTYGAVAARYLAPRLAVGDVAFGDWSRALEHSRLGRDLGLRARALPLVYGRAARPTVERWLTRSHALGEAGAAYFAGEQVPRLRLVRAAMDLAWTALCNHARPHATT